MKTRRIIKWHKWTEYPTTQQVINTVNKWGGDSKKTEYGANLEFRNCTKEIFDWDTEYDLYGQIYPDPGINPELAADFTVVILEE